MIEKYLRAACEWIAARCQLRAITRDDASPYLDRYYLFGRVPKHFPEPIRPRLAWLPVTVFLHHFRDSDRDEELHNHPWTRAVSLVLVGGYLEERRATDLPGYSYRIERREVHPGDLNVIGKDDFHRVTLGTPDAWTVFVTGTKAQSWGFWHPKTGEFIPWREHLARRQAERKFFERVNARGGRA